MAYTEREIIAESNMYHVSNVKLNEYLDDARADWYKYSVNAGVEPVVVHISADYKKEIFPKDLLRIRTSLERVGNTSFTLKHTVMNQRDELAVSAEVVLATIDRQKRTKVAVPNEIRNLMDNPDALDLTLLNR